MQREFVFPLDRAPTPQCHAATVATIDGGVIVAWFGGEKEGADDVGIYAAARRGGVWEAPAEIVTAGDAPCWNPVFGRDRDGRLHLYYRVGPSPSSWRSEVRVSTDDGRTWGPVRRLPEGYLGPIKNKPVLLDDGRFLHPSSTEHDGWRCVIEIGEAQRIAIADPLGLGAIQPAVVKTAEGFTAWCRTKSGVIGVTRSADGRRWTPLEATSLPNPNSGIDAVAVADDRVALVWNPVGKAPDRWGGARTPLVVSVVDDDASVDTLQVLEDEPGEFSYPSVVTDGAKLFVVYTFNRRGIACVETST